ncbi:SSI family serine proteinase inhibitor [Streptomyces halobius]|uniref:Subtilase-type protease inhibitor n=1 Tax=Streptomyces halobius TaxID=2879846 RepID=A0ABY4MCQ2_9ACTN|nr:SSI family serine proteinase inhibitor [Streptomyces halobius]UQA94180.1 subtilase-type protease inhibitor [Streptomyces halobius]
MPHRRTSRFAAAATTATAALSVVSALAAATPAASAAAVPLPERRAQAGPPASAGRPSSGDHLTVTVADSGVRGRDGTHELFCHPAHGDHPEAEAACDGLDELTTWGKDPFAPVPPDARCTMIYGGPATAHVEGTWAGRPVNADYKRTNGCEIHQWDRMEPLLPRTGS